MNSFNSGELTVCFRSKWRKQVKSSQTKRFELNKRLPIFYCLSLLLSTMIAAAVITTTIFIEKYLSDENIIIIILISVLINALNSILFFFMISILHRRIIMTNFCNEVKNIPQKYHRFFILLIPVTGAMFIIISVVYLSLIETNLLITMILVAPLYSTGLYAYRDLVDNCVRFQGAEEVS